VFETGMNAAVAKLADAAAGGGRARGAREPLKVLGPHPRTEAEIKLMEGRFGPYVTDGTTNATLPKSLAPDALTLEEAAQLIDERAAKGAPAKKGRRGGAAKKPPAKKKPSAKKKA
jgi:DNA topoisomerase-1